MGGVRSTGFGGGWVGLDLERFAGGWSVRSDESWRILACRVSDGRCFLDSVVAMFLSNCFPKCNQPKHVGPTDSMIAFDAVV